MIVISDTNIVSSFAAAEALPLLLDALHVDHLVIPSAVYDELQAGIAAKVAYLQPISHWIDSKILRVAPLTAEQLERAETLPQSFGAGERQGIILTDDLRGTLLTNEKRVVNYCTRNRLLCLNLSQLLRLLWKEKVATPDQVRTFMRRMTEAEGITFKDDDQLFAS